MTEQLQLDFDKIIKTSNISKKNIDSKRNHLKKFIESGFPNRKQEDWKFLDISQIIKKNIKNLSFFNDVSKMLSNTERPLIIFPQGTRVLPKERPPFKKGASRIYEELKIICQPVAINSGYVWPKKGSKRHNRTITISILKAINPGKSKDEYIKILENNIYSELDLLN